MSMYLGGQCLVVFVEFVDTPLSMFVYIWALGWGLGTGSLMVEEAPSAILVDTLDLRLVSFFDFAF
jgi:hypothetical protein